tara:strand:- start:12471 stop:13643 length:1173 start_codon:yes stop_codon:yes gene_type:complete
MTVLIIPTRTELKKFLPDQKTVKAFEALFNAADPDLGALTDQVNTNTDNIDDLLVVAFDGTSTPPNFERPGLTPDYIDMARGAKSVNAVGRMSWNRSADTLNIGHEGGVQQQVGSELYAHIQSNNLGSAILDGQIVGISGTGSDITLFMADGTYPAEYVVGMATQQIEPGGGGRVTVWGRVHGINTVAYSTGDTVYVSPTVPGGITNVKPVAPDIVIPIGIVTVSNATEGEVFVRPIIELQMYYGSFARIGSQTPAVANTAYPIVITSSGEANGVAAGTPASRLVVANAGLYSIAASFQITSSSASAKDVWLWFRKNGVDVPNSAIVTSLESNSAIASPRASISVALSAGDYMEVMWASDSTAVTLGGTAATAFSPASPACTITIVQSQH